MIAVSEPVDAELADFISRVVADGVVAPGFEPGTAGTLSRKKHGTFLVLQADRSYEPPHRERRDVLGLTIEQERDEVPITTALLSSVPGPALPPAAVRDGLLGLAALRYTQSNSVVVVRDGAAAGIGAGQQNRVDCVKLAVAKAMTWWLRRHPGVRAVPRAAGMSRQDHLNWQIRIAEGDMTPGQIAEFTRLFPETEAVVDSAERAAWTGQLDHLTLTSDGFLPFRDNIDHASRIGVRCVIEPGGSSRSPDIAAACAEHNIMLIRTGLRLFHH
jgi:phosphoribosylaminoimidazolecarboxamide formyltransferase/IMP cyclohydrolase